MFDLFFVEPGEEDLPGPPVAVIFLNSVAVARFEYSGERDLLTPQLMTPQEVDYWANHWIKELEEIKTTARKKFASHRKKFASQRKRESGT